MLKTILFRVQVVLLLLFTSTGLAQDIELKGRIVDTLYSPLAYANVIARPLDVNYNMSFAIADVEGQYYLTLKKGLDYNIEVSFMGYKPYSYKIRLADNKVRDIVLFPLEEQLDEVVVLAELPVRVKKDTIIYKPKHFVSGTERKIKEVLKKLPGIEVNKDGTVYVRGKKVNTMLVDGKPFFGGNSKLAVENISADAITEIEVIDNYNKILFLKGLTDSQQLAI